MRALCFQSCCFRWKKLCRQRRGTALRRKLSARARKPIAQITVHSQLAEVPSWHWRSQQFSIARQKEQRHKARTALAGTALRQLLPMLPGVGGEEVLFLQVTSQSTEVFYKDEGGRQAHVQVDVKITNPRGLDLSHIPIVLQLHYENGYPVHNQEILSTIMAQHLETDARGGAILRFRIEEVSKNHRRCG